MDKILITGGAGNVGGALAELLVEKGYYVVIVDNLITGSKEKLPSKEYSNWKFYHKDANDLESITKVMKDEQPDYVFHYAALVGVDRTLENPIAVLDDLKGLQYICELCSELNVKRVFFSSSSEVYGEPVEFPQHEDNTPLNAKLPYAQVKAVGESFLKSYQQVYGLDYTIFRFFNTYGPKQSGDFVIGKFIRAALKGEDITLIGDGSQTRTFCYIDDNLSLTMKCLEEGMFKNELLNLGNDNEISVKDLGYFIKNVLGSPSKITHLPARKDGDMTRRLPCLKRMKSAYKKDLVDLETGVLRVAEALIERGDVKREEVVAQFNVALS